MNCKWCKRRLADQADNDTLPDGEDGGLCWREWNEYADCYRIEEQIREASAELLEALEGLGNYSNNTFCCCSVRIGDPRLKDHSTACRKAQAAIAKAKGDAEGPDLFLQC